jgi:hypothetical protein
MTKEVHFKIAKRLASLLDDRFEILGVKFGFDPIMDLFPVFGDILATAIGLYIVFTAKQLKMPNDVIFKMIINVAIDFLIGFVPVLGNIGTIFFRSNRKNIKIIEDYRRNGGGVIEEGVIVG